MAHPVICIGRQFGSGGREIGLAVSQKMGIPFYDKEILKKAAQDSGISQELFERADERPSSSFLYTLSIGAAPAFASYEDYLTDDKLFVFQSNTIRELAKQGPCVFIGRCADYVLRRQPGMLSVFIHAPLEQRVLRIAKLRNIDEDKARALIRKTDKTRANYYNYYADGDWGRADRYDLALNTGKLPIPVAASPRLRAGAFFASCSRQANPGGGLAAALQRPVIGMRLNTRERLFYLHHLSPGLQTGSHCANKAVSFLPSAASLARCLKLTLFTGQLRQLQNLRPHPEDVRAGPQIRPKQ